MTEQEKMREAVYANGFAVDEARLFLDTHPSSKEAMDYFQKKMNMYQEALRRYEENYGRITPESGVMDGNWAWATYPWPWEGGM